jgi:uncharacterized protein
LKYLLFTLIVVLLFLPRAKALDPQKQYNIRPDQYGIPYSEEYIDTPDGALLVSWVIPPFPIVNKFTSIILACPSSGNMEYYIQQAFELSRIGYTAILFDYRGFGESSEFNIYPELFYYDEFASDLASVISWAKNEYEDFETGVWGFEMGATIAPMAFEIEAFDFLIAESAVIDSESYSGNLSKYKFKTIKFPPSHIRIDSLFKNLKIQTLMFYGEKDKLTPIKNIKKSLKKNKNIKIVKYRGGHLGAFQSMTKESTGDEQIKKIIKFLGDDKVKNKVKK